MKTTKPKKDPKTDSIPETVVQNPDENAQVASPPVTNEENEKKTDRDASGKFVPGEWKGWPGRPKGLRSVKTIFEQAIKEISNVNNGRDVEVDLIKTLLDQAKSGNLKAMEMVLDRMHGKPVQHNINQNVDNVLFEDDLTE